MGLAVDFTDPSSLSETSFAFELGNSGMCIDWAEGKVGSKCCEGII